MAQEGEAHVGVAPDATESGIGVGGSFRDRVATQVGEFARLEVGPDEFNGVVVAA